MEIIINFIFDIIGGKFGAFLLVVFGLASIFCWKFWLTYKALKIHFLWAVAVFIIPLADLLFSFFYWKSAKKPFLYTILFLSLALGIFVARSFVSTFFNTDMIEGYSAEIDSASKNLNNLKGE